MPLAPPLLKVTVPDGADLVPLSLSVTVAVQDELSLIGTDAGEQVTFVVVDRLTPVTVEPVASELVACKVSPP